MGTASISSVSDLVHRGRGKYVCPRVRACAFVCLYRDVHVNVKNKSRGADCMLIIRACALVSMCTLVSRAQRQEHTLQQPHARVYPPERSIEATKYCHKRAHVATSFLHADSSKTSSRRDKGAAHVDEIAAARERERERERATETERERASKLLIPLLHAR